MFGRHEKTKRLSHTPVEVLGGCMKPVTKTTLIRIIDGAAIIIQETGPTVLKMIHEEIIKLDKDYETNKDRILKLQKDQQSLRNLLQAIGFSFELDN